MTFKPATQDQRAKILQNMDRLRENYLKHIELQGKMRIGLMQKWIKEDAMEISDKGFLDLLKTYHLTVENGEATIMYWRGHQLDMGYAKYLLEYLEEAFRRTGSSSFVLNVRAEHRRHHDAMKIKTTKS